MKGVLEWLKYPWTEMKKLVADRVVRKSRTTMLQRLFVAG